MRRVGGVRKSKHQSWLAKGLRLGLLCWGFKGVEGEIPSSNRVSGISTRIIHQSTNQSFSQTIWPRWASRQFLSLPIVEPLLPVTFGNPLSSEAVVVRQSRRWKRLWQRSLTYLHKRTSIGTSRSCWNGTNSLLQPEEITSKGIEFHVCTINKSAHTKKRLETYLMILVYRHLPKTFIDINLFCLLKCVNARVLWWNDLSPLQSAE